MMNLAENAQEEGGEAHTPKLHPTLPFFLNCCEEEASQIRVPIVVVCTVMKIYQPNLEDQEWHKDK